MLSFTRWLTTIIAVLVLVARSVAVGTTSSARADASVMASISSAYSPYGAVASTVSAAKHLRNAWRTDAPLAVSSILRGITCLLGDDHRGRVPADPCDLRIVVTHDATGPPGALLT